MGRTKAAPRAILRGHHSPPKITRLALHRVGALSTFRCSDSRGGKGDRVLDGIRHVDEVKIGRRCHASRRHDVPQPVHEPVPIRVAKEDHGELGDGAGLHQGERLEQLVKVPKPPGSTMKPCAYFTKHVLRTKK